MKNKEIPSRIQQTKLNTGNMKLSNKLAEAKYAMSISQQKLFLYAVRNLNDDNFPISTFKLSDFAKYADLDVDRLYRDIKPISEQIMRVLIYEEDVEEPDGWAIYTFTDNCRYSKGVVTFEFNQRIKPMVLGLNNHYFMQAPETMGFSRWYSFRLYDLIKSRMYKGKDIIVDLEWIKERFGIENKYSDYSNFRKRVIDPSVKEINKHSDIRVSFEPIKRGRTVTELQFRADNYSDSYNGVPADEYTDVLKGWYNIEEFKDKIGLTPKVFTDIEIIELYEIAKDKFQSARSMMDLYEYMRLNYTYTRERVKHSKPYNYYSQALQDDYAKAIPQVMVGYYV